MRKFLVQILLACGAVAHIEISLAQSTEFSFGVIGHSMQNAADDPALRAEIIQTDQDNLAFIVVNGIKAATEPCSDTLYQHRKALLDEAKNGLIVSLAGNDWAECRTALDHSAAVERLNRLRELFFLDEFSLGASRIPLVRQSAIAKFRGYGENTRWEIGDIMFATINLPANNNHYRIEAGRNSEFEDRLIANRDWLQRIFSFSARKKFAGIVLFCDGNPLSPPTLMQRSYPVGKRDGFSEIRQQINALTAKFPGKVLVIHSQEDTASRILNDIVWHKNLGDLGLVAGWMKLMVDRSRPEVFAISTTSAGVKNRNP